MERKRILWLALMVALIAVVAWAMLRHPEPMYEGKPLYFWLAGYAPPRNETNIKASDRALQAIGTNAIPFLLPMLRQTDSPLKLRLEALLKKQHFIRIHWLTDFDRVVEAGSGFQALGSNALPALPALIQIFQSQTNGSPSARWVAASMFGTIGPVASNTIPMLVASLSDSKDSARSYVIGALGKMHSRPDLSVPALIKCLNDPDLDCVFAAKSLAQFGPEARSAMPALINLSKRRDTMIGATCLQALELIDPTTEFKAEPKLQ